MRNVRYVLAFVCALLVPALASAQESPPGCNANEFDVTLQAIPVAAVAGATVNYFVFMENTGVQAGCDVTNLQATFTCPGADGQPTGPPSFPVPAPTSWPFPTAPQLVGTFQCVMPDPPSGFAVAKVEGTFTLQTATPSPNSFLKTIAVTIQDCLVEVDKQVSCDGGATWIDQGFVSSNEDGTFSCQGINNITEIMVRYFARNAGQVRLFQCTLDDSNNAFDLDPDGVLITSPIEVGGVVGPIAAPGRPLCSDALDAAEPNTASVNCFCTPQLDPDLKASASDSADVLCQSVPELNLVKLCPEPGPTGTNAISVTASATTADVGFVDCTVTDRIFLSDPTCPADVGAVGTPVALTPATFNLAAGSSVTATGVVGPLAANACNTASVTCTIAGTDETRTATDDVVCTAPGRGCNTRTPGFWGNRPAITKEFLNVSVCGVTLDNVEAGNTTSAIEAICSVGRDGQILGPQLTQLVRQCTAAALNIASSAEGGGNCSTTFPNLANQMANCCSAQSVCTGFPNDNFTVNSCIEALDAFNNSIDTLPPFGPFVSPGAADSSVCRDARNNGVVVTPAR
jgi:hypothetical protein